VEEKAREKRTYLGNYALCEYHIIDSAMLLNVVIQQVPDVHSKSQRFKEVAHVAVDECLKGERSHRPGRYLIRINLGERKKANTDIPSTSFASVK
jgi:hypothetical protein